MRKVLILSFLLCLGVVAKSQNVQDTTGLYRAGTEKLNAGDYAGAIRDFNQITHVDPSNANALMQRAFAKYYLNTNEGARNDVDKAISINPNIAEARYLSGLLYMNAKDYDKAVGEFDFALSKKNYYPEAYSAKLLCFHYQGKTKEALDMAKTATETNPQEPAYWYIQGVLLILRNKPDDAVKSFDQAQSIDSKYNPFNICLNRGNAYMAMENTEKAVDDFTSAIGIKPDNASAYHSRGLAYYQTQEYEKAIKDFSRSIEINPDNSATYFNLGMTYLKMDDQKNACRNFRISCKMQNKNACKMTLTNCAGL
jgi:tetratricopeptide (TPR) repeat protein